VDTDGSDKETARILSSGINMVNVIKVKIIIKMSW